MISDVSQYYYVKGEDEDVLHPHGDLDRILIDGSIMPFRDGVKKNVLRGEDIVFLKEFCCERISAMNGDDSIDRRLRYFSRKVTLEQKANLISAVSRMSGYLAPVNADVSGRWTFADPGESTVDVLRRIGVLCDQVDIEYGSSCYSRAEIEQCFNAIVGKNGIYGLFRTPDERHDDTWRVYRESNEGSSWVDAHTAAAVFYRKNYGARRVYEDGSYGPWTWYEEGRRAGPSDRVAVTRNSGSSRFVNSVLCVWGFYLDALSDSSRRKNWRAQRSGYFILPANSTWRDVWYQLYSMNSEWSLSGEIPDLFGTSEPGRDYDHGPYSTCECYRDVKAYPDGWIVRMDERTFFV